MAAAQASPAERTPDATRRAIPPAPAPAPSMPPAASAAPSAPAPTPSAPATSVQPADQPRSEDARAVTPSPRGLEGNADVAAAPRENGFAASASPAPDRVGAIPGSLAGPRGEDSGDHRDTLFAAQERWDLIKQVCKQKSRSVAALLHSARPVLVEPGEVPVLVLQADHRFHLEKLRSPASREAVEWALEQVLETRVRVRLAPSAGNGGEATGGGGTNGSGGNGGSGVRPSGGGPSTSGAPRSASPAPNGTHPAAADAGRGSAVRNGTNGGALRDASEGYVPANVTPIRAMVSPAAQATATTNGRASRPLDDEVRADAVIQALMHTYGAELADVHPLDGDDGDDGEDGDG